jgi:hypothetical protein
VIIGWDVSTSAIGICVRTVDGTTVEFGVIYPTGASHAQKHQDAAHQVTTFCNRMFNKHGGKFTHVVEERLGGFTGGMTTKQTLMCLAAMNAVVSFVLSQHGDVMHLAPVTTKRITGLKVPKGGNKKLEVIKLVRSREPSFPYTETKAGNYCKGVDDMADAWLLAEAGGKVLRGEASIGHPKKAAGGKKKARGAEAGGSPQG